MSRKHYPVPHSAIAVIDIMKRDQTQNYLSLRMAWAQGEDAERRKPSRLRAVSLIYVIVVMPVIVGFVSLMVDYGLPTWSSRNWRSLSMPPPWPPPME